MGLLSSDVPVSLHEVQIVRSLIGVAGVRRTLAEFPIDVQESSLYLGEQDPSAARIEEGYRVNDKLVKRDVPVRIVFLEPF